MNNTILIIGSSGYLGSSLSNTLSKSFKIIEFDLPNNFLNIEPKWIEQNNIDYIINTAYLPANDTLNHDEFMSNIYLPLHLIKVLQSIKSKIPLIHFSTREVIGNTLNKSEIQIQTDGTFYPKRWYNELSDLSPRNLYGWSKLISEELVSKYDHGVIIRLSTPYTDFFSSSRGGLISRLCYSSKNHGQVSLANAGYQVRDPIHIDDIANLIQLIFRQNFAVLPKVFCVGGGITNIISLRELCIIANPKVEIIDTDGGDYGFVFDNMSVQKYLNWTPTLNIRDQIKRYAIS